ncbi:MAG: GrpB family protein [Streptosporangiaceae bacterium]
MVRVVCSSPLGITRGQVEIADSCPDWPSVVGQIEAEIVSALAGLPATVEHVGSTAVPGLAAKPAIDIAVGIDDDVDLDRVVAALEPLGYLYRVDLGEWGGQLFILEDKPDHRIAYIHVVSTQDPQWRRYLEFRDLLRVDASARAA